MEGAFWGEGGDCGVGGKVSIAWGLVLSIQSMWCILGFELGMERNGGGFSCGATIFSEACQPIHLSLTQEDRYVSGF